jgi:hypothetical protein
MQCEQHFAVMLRQMRYSHAVRLPVGLLIFLTGSMARAEEAPVPPKEPAQEAVQEAPKEVPKGRIAGRVWERGAIIPLAGARVTAGDVEVTTGQDGRFTMDLPAGAADLAITADDYRPLRVKETVTAGQGLNVEYYLERRKARYESTVRGEARHEGERFQLRDEELHNAPGTLGEPFRVLGLLPGVATPLPLLPVYVIRGASPGTNGFFLDGMRVPQLFHFLVGGGVVHGRTVDRMDFYPGAYDASFGRYAGGVVDAETRPARGDGQHGEVQLRIFDISTLGEIKLPKGVRISLSGQYGWPGVIASAIDNRLKELTYGDFQLRLDWRGLTVQALGSYDRLSLDPRLFGGGAAGMAAQNFRLAFYRVQVRYRHRVKNIDMEAGLYGGLDEMETFGSTGVRKLALNWRYNLRAKWKRFTLSFGTDGEISRFTAENFDTMMMGPQAPDQFGELAGDRNGVIAGAYLSGTAEIVRDRWFATLGARADVYHANAVTLVGIDPRLQTRLKLLPWLYVQAGVGVYQQPPSFPVPLPGIDTFALQLGLQRAYQGAVSIEAKVPEDISLKLTGYWQQFQNVNDFVVDFGGPQICTSPPPESLTGLPATVTRQIDGHSYGMEVLLRRHAGRFTGWIAYTLSRSERIFTCGLRPADYDQTHILNVVTQIRLPWKLLLGARFYFATGRPITLLDPDRGLSQVRNAHRLANYPQLDIRLDREFTFKRWSLAVFLEILNVIYSENVIGVVYPEENMIRRYDMPQFQGFRWILPTIGLRGMF